MAGDFLTPASPPAEQTSACQSGAALEPPQRLRLSDGGGRSPEHLAMAGRNLWLLGIWVEQPLKKILPYHRCDELTDEPTHAHIPELCL
jgi:hypothetical protein